LFIRIPSGFVLFGAYVILGFCFFETGSHYLSHTGLELVILLPPFLECWNYRHATPCHVYKTTFLKCKTHYLK
jgi:hypothetical protein